MGMLIDLISCSHFLVATVFMNACRDIWWLSIERQQNIAQLVVKTCRNHHTAVRQSYSPLFNASVSSLSLFFYIGPSFISLFVLDSAGASRDSYQVTVDPNIILAWLKLTELFLACTSPDMKTVRNIEDIEWTLSKISYISYHTFCIDYFRQIFYTYMRFEKENEFFFNTCACIRTQYMQPYFLDMVINIGTLLETYPSALIVHFRGISAKLSISYTPLMCGVLCINFFHIFIISQYNRYPTRIRNCLDYLHRCLRFYLRIYVHIHIYIHIQDIIHALSHRIANRFWKRV